MKPYRKEKLASLIRELVAESIAFELADPRITPLTSVSRVVVSDDLQVARVMLSVPGDESQERLTLQALQHARGHLQRLVGRNVRTRLVPELRLEIDIGAKRARQTLRLIEENQIRRAALEGASAASKAGATGVDASEADVSEADAGEAGASAAAAHGGGEPAGVERGEAAPNGPQPSGPQANGPQPNGSVDGRSTRSLGGETTP